ncbi:MAG TPA: radical SAM protein, partial [Candidatus Hydrogenedentes bacterium]|nr:radical SAM protein [Candidatus Hydrogenedentota bacterium]
MRCRWCDTAYSFHGGTPMDVDEVMEAVRASDCRLVELTGGEPLAQPAAAVLAARLLEERFEVLVETGGY